MKYEIVSAPYSEKLVELVQLKLNEGWQLHGNMTHIIYKNEVEFYQPITKKSINNFGGLT